ncbi:MAG: dihydroorotate dehydrogenase electron transfer subunit [Candidatus Omnitrophica bacterium]|nr:dihydroorotate dehydrogenase electron transfer subunit [Candidatus Omnitrophota bacterium]
MKQLKAKIIGNKRIAPDFYKMRLASAYLAKNSKPGQFVEIECSKGGEIFLRRPLGVHRILNDGIEVLYEVVGPGTKSLSAKTAGEYIDIIGPLGNGFFVQRTAYSAQRTAALVAGGVGVAPLVALAETLVNSSKLIVHSKRRKLYVLIGACKKGHVLCVNDLKKLGAEVVVYTEDGSLGKKGLITQGLTSLLSTINYELSTIYACGPYPMLKAISHIADSSGISCQVSMEERMACGVGVCLGCPVKAKSGGYKMVCKDGPVFDSKEIAW